MNFQRYFIELAYDGTPYHGWQRQPNGISVQEVLEDALMKILRLTSAPITGCGRTDKGVHAHFFVAHADLPVTTSTEELVYKLNKLLPISIAITRIYPVDTELHARFSATERTYRYFLHQEKSPFKPNSLYHRNDLDFDTMNEAANDLLGTQDFTSLSKLHTDVKTNICTIKKAHWVVTPEQTYFEITADRFLRNMVRATVGTLLEIGTGKISKGELPIILAAKDRSEAKTSVPGNALFLWDIRYPESN